jgi:hypothetical protein
MHDQDAQIDKIRDLIGKVDRSKLFLAIPMTATLSKLPTSTRPLINDTDLADAVERMLAPYTGKALERAQAAVRRVHGSAVQGPFSTVLAAYQAAVAAAVGKEASDG